MTDTTGGVGIVVIGRNEGERLKRCLRAIPSGHRIVYVDSGSTDGSLDFARSFGVEVVELPPGLGFTAARARNAGWRKMGEGGDFPQYIQFIDGDCELDPNWLAAGKASLDAEPGLAASFGRLRERHPDASLYNRLCDDEWNVPEGLVSSCGGIAMFRSDALLSVGGFCDDLVAGEEPDLCLRLSRLDWSVRRISPEMALHDAAIHRFKQWWTRARRSGFAYAEHNWKNGRASLPHWRRQMASILVWGGALPLIASSILLLASIGISTRLTIFVTTMALYVVQVLRIAGRKRRDGASVTYALKYACLMVLGKFAEFTGAVGFWKDRVVGRGIRAFEYKSA